MPFKALIRKYIPKASRSQHGTTQQDDVDQRPRRQAQAGLDTPPPEDSSSSLHPWVKAYRNLNETDPRLVEAFETLVQGSAVRSQATETADAKVEDMKQFASDSLGKIEKERKGKENVGKALHVVKIAREIGGPLIQQAPHAALPWACLCGALDLVANPITESQAQADGVVHVLFRMGWYEEIYAQLAIKACSRQDGLANLRSQHQESVLSLYGDLLLFLMRSTCSCYKNRWTSTMRDILKLNLWEDSLNAVKNREAEIRQDSFSVGNFEIQATLDRLLRSAEDSEAGFQKDITTFLQRQVDMVLNEQEKTCLRDLCLKDPRTDNQLEYELVPGCYEWILNNKEFKEWRYKQNLPLIWIRGDAGKGKTNLIRGMIQELESSVTATNMVSYFFCFHDRPDSNSCAAVLRGLLYDMARQDRSRSAITHIREKYGAELKALLSGPSSQVSLQRMLAEVLDIIGTETGTTYLAIDALDECQDGRLPLLRFIATQASLRPSVKWIISSRNLEDIEMELRGKGGVAPLSLEVNANSVSEAVSFYIDKRVSRLQEDLNLNQETTDTVREHLQSNADGTFLWVALVCEALARQPNKLYVLYNYKNYPSGLDSVYSRMVDSVLDSQDQHSPPGLFRDVLAVATHAHRPLTLWELLIYVRLPPGLAPQDETSEQLMLIFQPVIRGCCSFLTIRPQTNEVIFVHKSAKDYLVKHGMHRLLGQGETISHHDILSASLKSMENGLVENVCDLDHVATAADDVEPQRLEKLRNIEYACVYWIDHLGDIITGPDNDAASLTFRTCRQFLEVKVLCWLEAISLLKSVPRTVSALTRLLSTLQSHVTPNASEMGHLLSFVEDCQRFILRNNTAITLFPRQVYISALLFSPLRSLVRMRSEKNHLPRWVQPNFAMQIEWDACMQTMQDHIIWICFSNDGKKFASASEDMVFLWDWETRSIISEFKVDEDPIGGIAFSPDDTKLACLCENFSHIVDLRTGQPMQKLYHGLGPHWVYDLAFSFDGKFVIFRVGGKESWEAFDFVWESQTGRLDKHGWFSPSIYASWRAVSYGGQRSVSFAEDDHLVVEVRCFLHKDLVGTRRFDEDCWILALSRDGSLVATLLSGRPPHISLWESTSGKTVQTINLDSADISLRSEINLSRCRTAFSPRDTHMAFSFVDNSGTHVIRIVAVDTGQCTQSISTHDFMPDKLVFAADGLHLIGSSRYSGPFKIWKIDHQDSQETGTIGHKSHLDELQVSETSQFSRNGNKVIAATGFDFEIWDLATNDRHTIQRLSRSEHIGQPRGLDVADFDPVTAELAALDLDTRIQLCSTVTGKNILGLHYGWTIRSELSPGGEVFAYWEKKWGEKEITEPNPPLTLQQLSDCTRRQLEFPSSEMSKGEIKGKIEHAMFSSDGKYFVSIAHDTAFLWDTSTAACVSHFPLDSHLPPRHPHKVFCGSKLIACHSHGDGGQFQVRALPRGEIMWGKQRDLWSEGPGMFSSDDVLVAVPSLWHIDVFDTSKGQLLWHYETPAPVLITHFSGLEVNTSIGTVVLGTTADREGCTAIKEGEDGEERSESDESYENEGCGEEAHFSGLTISVDEAWLVWNDVRLVFLPIHHRPRYLDRPVNFHILGYNVLMGCRNDGPMVMRFDPEELAKADKL